MPNQVARDKEELRYKTKSTKFYPVVSIFYVVIDFPIFLEMELEKNNYKSRALPFNINRYREMTMKISFAVSF